MGVQYETTFLLEKHEGKRPFGRHRSRWVYNMKLHFWLSSMRERDHLEDIGVDGCTI
jgi:hypothetical protein